ncbi:MAG: hypothetical protein ABIE94_02490 [archaeon]
MKREMFILNEGNTVEKRFVLGIPAEYQGNDLEDLIQSIVEVHTDEILSEFSPRVASIVGEYLQQFIFDNYHDIIFQNSPENDTDVNSNVRLRVTHHPKRAKNRVTYTIEYDVPATEANPKGRQKMVYKPDFVYSESIRSEGHPVKRDNESEFTYGCDVIYKPGLSIASIAEITADQMLEELGNSNFIGGIFPEALPELNETLHTSVSNYISRVIAEHLARGINSFTVSPQMDLFHYEGKEHLDMLFDCEAPGLRRPVTVHEGIVLADMVGYDLVPESQH